MFHSLTKLAATLDDDLVVYPGHGYSVANSTIGGEKTGGVLSPRLIGSEQIWANRMLKR
jgi:glyoxylase-like metal-dependent hydrolase (beta-lactamase superfamily II)